MTRVAGVLAALRERLGAASPSAALDAEILVAHVAGTGRPALAADPDRPLCPEELLALESLARRRLAGEPVAYLTGRREFWSLDLEVTPEVLVPRPETELAVERVLAALGDGGQPAVLDLGTGSGAIALAVAHERPDAAVTATDVSAAALAVAKRNATRLGLKNLRFLEGSWFDPLAGSRFDVIASNPPYVAAGDPALAALAHEPRAALLGGTDGLAAIEAIVCAAPFHLEPGGWLIVEHGAAQGAAVRALFAAAGLAAVATRPDLAGHERVTEGTLPR
ncbi:MAG TPA: peptide chain release factor N(5)-glutamine methyltransferase [Steroidobacteraceae bacterium]|nr:peptide chain release factor N(5)-glutamine methyltransferase [Steroidobacteraceae bacterium]